MSLLTANFGTAQPTTIAAGLMQVEQGWQADQVRRAIALDQYRAVVAARIRWWHLWELDQAAFREWHFLSTGKRDVWRLLAAINEREAYWTKQPK